MTTQDLWAEERNRGFAVSVAAYESRPKTRASAGSAGRRKRVASGSSKTSGIHPYLLLKDT